MPGKHSTDQKSLFDQVEGEKRCGRCKETKALTEFGKVKGKHRSYCRGCHAVAWKNPDLRAEKKCSKCRVTKQVTEFNKCGVRYQSYCNPCRVEVTQKRNELYRASGIFKERHRTYYVGVHKWRKLLTKYGMDQATYEAMYKAQDGVCAICRTPETDRYMGRTLILAVDHDHKTGKVRGLLCRGCNMAIGKLGEDVDVLQRAIDYLNASNAR